MNNFIKSLEMIRFMNTIFLNKSISIKEVLDRQMPRSNNIFICRNCSNWNKNTVGCKENYFISTIDCYIAECGGFKSESNNCS